MNDHAQSSSPARSALLPALDNRSVALAAGVGLCLVIALVAEYAAQFAPLVGADLSVMARDAAAVRGGRPTVFTSLVADPAATEVAAWVRAVRISVAPA